jgi:hypothetical protein
VTRDRGSGDGEALGGKSQPRRVVRRPGGDDSEAKMLDLIFVALTIAFFALALAYVRGCEKLQ